MLKHTVAFIVVAALLVVFILAIAGCATAAEKDRALVQAYKEGFASGLSMCRPAGGKPPCKDPTGKEGCTY